MTPPPRFNLRLTPELEALVVQSSKKNRRSKNAEILSAIEWRYQPDAALKLAEALRPLLATLSEEQIEMLLEVVNAMAAGIKKKPARRGS